MANEVHPVFQDLVNGLAVIANGKRCDALVQSIGGFVGPDECPNIRPCAEHSEQPAGECGDPCEAGAITCPLIGCDSCKRDVPGCHLSPILHGGRGCHACEEKALADYGAPLAERCGVCNG